MEKRTTECPSYSSTWSEPLPRNSRVASPVHTGATGSTGSSGACVGGNDSNHSAGTRSSGACARDDGGSRHNPVWGRSVEEQRESFWLRQMYSDMVDRLRSKTHFGPNAEKDVDEMIRRIHRLKTQEDCQDRRRHSISLAGLGPTHALGGVSLVQFRVRHRGIVLC